ncbi:MAG: RNA polymerase sigma factor [Prevotella sp.]|nr:RNA polymerase sigma factor [Prevotella sp.]
MQNPTDISLVTQVAVSGNRRAFDELVRRYQSPIRRFFLHQTLGDSQLSDDLAQDTFLKAYTHISMFRGLASFQTWLMRIAYNVFYDYTRSRKQTSDIDDVQKQTAASSIAVKLDVYAALTLLKPDERTCITLQLIDGYDIRQIAEITQMKEGTVKSHLSRGKEKMANYLRKNGYGR